MPLAGVRTVDEIISESLAIDRFSVVLFASFGVLGVVAGCGWYLRRDGVRGRATYARVWSAHGARRTTHARHQDGVERGDDPRGGGNVDRIEWRVSRGACRCGECCLVSMRLTCVRSVRRRLC